MMSPDGGNLGGSGMMGNDMAFCVSSRSPNFSFSSFDSGPLMSTELVNSECSLEPGDNHLGYAMGSSMVQKKGEKLGVDLQSTMRDASFTKTNGELPTHFEYSPKKIRISVFYI
jgi:hypothetical protein